MGHIAWLHRGRLSREQAGGKGASLADLTAAGFRVPPGFCVTADGYRRFIRTGGIGAAIDQALADGGNSAVEAIGRLIESTPLPPDLSEEVVQAYDDLAAMTGLACAVRSSATAEDGSAASFAGLYESYLNLIGVASVLSSVKRCYASLWSERAISYRARSGIPLDEAMAVVVMGLVNSEASGIAFTAHPVTGARDQVVINASWGLGEAIVAGRVTPDAFVVQKQTLALMEREVYTKAIAIYPHPDGGGTVERSLPAAKAGAPSLSDDEAREVARVAALVEQHYGAPQDIEWALAGGEVFLLQSRPITTL